MANPPKEKRNKDLVEKKEQGWSFRQLSEHFNIDVRAAWEIYHRDKDKYTKKAVDSYPQKKA